MGNRGKKWEYSAILTAFMLSACLGITGCAKDGGTSGEQEQPAGSPAAASSPATEKSSEEGGKGAAMSAAMQIPAVTVQKVQTKKRQYSHEWPAQTKAGENVDVRARVEGTLENFSFQEGFAVHAGQVLFTLDDAPYVAELQSAQARVAQAQADLDYAKAQVNVRKAKADLASQEASLIRAQQDVDRYKPLAQSGVIPQQTLDNAIAQRDVCQAAVDASKAALRNTELSDKANIEVAEANLSAAQAQVTKAKLNIDYCVITSPISGCIGKLNVDPGNLVGQMGNTTPLVVISKLDPMYVNFNLSESEYLMIMENRDQEVPGGVEFKFITSDGKTYNHNGSFNMLDRAVDAQSGTIGVRLVFPNPDFILREGMFGRVRITTKGSFDCIVIPQKAVITAQSEHNVYVVNGENKVESRLVQIDVEDGSDYIISSGIKPGEFIIVDGIQKVRPGQLCNPKEETEAGV